MSFFARLEPAMFAFLVLVQLTPIWAFPFLATQDGPAHVANALILKDYQAPDARYREFYELKWEAIPNWASHLMLVGLAYVLPPLLAERVLASICLVGFAYSFRYFHCGLGQQFRLLSGLVVLFLFNRCFVMGFYSYYLSLSLFWIVLGYCVRNRDTFGFRQAGVLALLLLADYFTHLYGLMLAVGGAGWLLVTAPTDRLRKAALVAAAFLPSALLTANYFIHTGFLHSPAVGMVSHHLDALREGHLVDFLRQQWQLLNQNLFEPYEVWPYRMDLLTAVLYAGLVIATLAGPRRTPWRFWPLSARAAAVLLGIGLLVLFMVVPDSLGKQGGFLKARVAMLPPLLFLAGLRLPERPIARRLLGSYAVLLLGLNFVLVHGYFRAASADLQEFTAAVNHVGPRRTLWVVWTPPREKLVDYLKHAGDLYCLNTWNIDLNNYEARLNHFPVRFRSTVAAGMTESLTAAVAQDLDFIIAWGNQDPAEGVIPPSFREIFHEGRLRVFEKKNVP